MSNLCIIKTHRNKKFATINLTAEDDKNLSWKAKGIHTYLISRPDNWEVYLAEMEKRSTDGRDGLRSGLFELHKAGYLDWRQKNVNGKFEKTQYDIYEVPNASVIKKAGKIKPHTEKPEAVPHTGLPDTEKPEAVLHQKFKKSAVNSKKTKSEPHTALPDSGKSAPNIYHSNNNTNNQCIDAPQNGASISTSNEKKSYAEFVLMTEIEYGKLVEKHGEELTKKFIEKLDNWKGAAPKKRKYESDYRAILNWVVNAVNESIAKEQNRNGQQRNQRSGSTSHSSGRVFTAGQPGTGEYTSGVVNLRQSRVD